MGIDLAADHWQISVIWNWATGIHAFELIRSCPLDTQRYFRLEGTFHKQMFLQ